MLRLPPLVALSLALLACGGDASIASTSGPATTSSVTNATPATSTQSTTTTSTAPPETLPPTTTVPVADPVVQISVTIAADDIVVLVDGVAVDGRVAVELGSELRIEVIADIADEVHAHGYDVVATVGPTEPAVIEISANIPGIFDVELEGAHVLLLQLEVS